MSAELQMAFLGCFAVTHGGEPITNFRTTKTRALLCYLAMTGRMHLRPALAGLLWGEMPDYVAQRNLRKTLTYLRHSVAGHVIVERRHVAFNRDAPFWLDVAELEAAVSQVSGREVLSDEDVQRLKKAVDLYRDDFLAGFHVRDAATFEEWVLMERERLRLLALEGLSRLAEVARQRGNLPESIQVTRRLLALEPWREEAHRELMWLLAHSGQRSAALAQYETCRNLLLEELGVEPASATVELYKRINAGECFPASPLPSRPSGPPHNLPRQLTPLVGREAELAQIADLLAEPDCRLLTLVGPGGIGKTRLALAAAERQLIRTAAASDGAGAAFPHGVYLVSLTPVTSPSHIVPAIAKAVGLTLGTRRHEGRSSRQQLLAYLRQKRLLLILDNFEHLVDGAELLSAILTSAPGVQILATSRERLQLYGEQVYAVRGLSLPPEDEAPPAVEPEEVRAYASLALFLQSARRVRPDFTLTAGNLPHVIPICRLVEGTPLAIELAAAWVDTLSPAAIAMEIQQNFDFLETDLRDVAERHRSMRAVLDATWQRLGPAEQYVFPQLSVFRGGFTPAAGRAVLAEPDGGPVSVRTLSALVNKGLLQHNSEGDRYAVHELPRQYAAGKLAENPARERIVRRRHSAYYCALLWQREPDLKGAGQPAALADIDAEIENMRLAWDWAAAQNEYDQLRAAADALGCFFWWWGRLEEGQAIFLSAAGKIAPGVGSGGQRALAKILAWQSLFSRVLGQIEQACQLLEVCRGLIDEAVESGEDGQAEEAFIRLQTGLALATSDRRQAEQQCAESLALYEALDDLWGAANALDALAELASKGGHFDRAARLAERSLILRQRLGDRRGMANIYGLLGLILRDQGCMDTAERFVRDSIAIYEELGDRLSIVNGQTTLARLFSLCGRLDESQELLEACLATYEDLGMRRRVSYLTAGLALVNLLASRYEQAYSHAHKAHTQARGIGDERSAGFALVITGHVALARGQVGEAQRIYQESIALNRAIGQHENLAASLGGLGYAAWASGQTLQAWRSLIEALTISAETRGVVPTAHALPGIALLLMDAGEVERAVELYALVSHLPIVAKSWWFQELVGRHIAAAGATLPPQVAEAAQARGRALHLWETVHELLDEFAPPSSPAGVCLPATGN